MDGVFVKTDAGVQELKNRQHDLTRAARNLLFVIASHQPASAWLAKVQGSTADDIQTLLRLGLIQAEVESSPPAAEPSLLQSSSTTKSLMDASSILAAPIEIKVSLSFLDRKRILLNQAKKHLNVIRYYWFSQDIDRCQTEETLEKLAHQWVSELREKHGLMVAARACNELRLMPRR